MTIFIAMLFAYFAVLVCWFALLTLDLIWTRPDWFVRKMEAMRRKYDH